MLIYDITDLRNLIDRAQSLTKYINTVATLSIIYYFHTTYFTLLIYNYKIYLLDKYIVIFFPLPIYESFVCNP